jgi:CDP-diacylglycerol pyrophosphatase
MDCLKPDVITALRAHQNEFSEEWSKTPISLSNHDYRVRILDHEDLEGINPFQILKDDLQDASLMSRHTLILIGAKLPEGRNGFYLLDGTSDPSDTAHRAHGEDLLDVKCAAATLSP